MCDSANQPKGLKGKHCDNASTEVGTDEIDDYDHEHTNDSMGFERGKGHLLTQGFKLCLSSCNFFLVALVLGLNDMGILQFIQFFIQFLDLCLMM